MLNNIPSAATILQSIANIGSECDFNSTALSVFYFQYQQNTIFRQWVDLLGVKPEQVKHYSKIPFLPISFFKSHQIVSGIGKAEVVFSSSGTTGMQQSKHYVTHQSVYQEAYLQSFANFYGDISDYTILALLPSYLEREGSSLIMMVEDLIKRSRKSESGFYLYNYDELHQALLKLRAQNRKTILIGVSFALLEFAEEFAIDFPELIVMETGGMKGRRKELIRQELHQILQQSFGVSYIHSEYGMTELLSQAYSSGKGIFKTPPWMQVLIRDTNDPLSLLPLGRSGGINVIDLYNLYSCSFVATQDLGKKLTKNEFEILGRFDHSDVRGCNLLVL